MPRFRHNCYQFLATLAIVVALVLTSCTASPTSNTSSSAESTSPTTTDRQQQTTTSVLGDDKEIWRPRPGTTWQWQLTGAIDTSVEAEMFDVDLFETPISVIEDLHAKDHTVICYFSAGSWEDFRPDSDDFDSVLLGESNGWPGERWLDIRRLDILGPVIEARLDLCKAKGFDGVEPDNIDGYTNNTGFPLTADDQLTFNQFLADAAHVRNLSVGLKNDMEQIAELEPSFDWAINEQCAEFDECGLLVPFIDANKAVFHVEYDLGVDTFCPKTTGLGFSSMQKNHNLDAWRDYCP